jgi:hypothetical protein
MLLFEALRQTSLIAVHDLLGLSPARLFLTACCARFTRFAELELPVACRAGLREPPTSAESLAIEMTMSQGDAPIATGTVELNASYPLEPIWRSGPTAPNTVANADLAGAAAGA